VQADRVDVRWIRLKPLAPVIKESTVEWKDFLPEALSHLKGVNNFAKAKSQPIAPTFASSPDPT